MPVLKLFLSRASPGGTAPVTTPAIRLGVHLRRAQHLLRQRMDERLRPLGLNAGLWSVLHEMVRAPGASSSELARSAFQTPQTVGGLIKRLTQLGLVEVSSPYANFVVKAASVLPLQP